MPDRLVEVHLSVWRAGVLTVALLIALGVSGVAQAEVEQQGDVIANFEGGITPHSLPREGVAPVAVDVAGTFKSTDGADPPPQLQTISIGINRTGKIFDKGLPTCRLRKIQPATIGAARRICGRAIVGSGHVQVRVHLTNQPPFTFKGPMLVFHARRAGGDRRLLAQVYGRRPPSAFVLAFKIAEGPGELGTVIKTSLPEVARKWAYVTHFDMRLHRTYTYHGERHSYISAGCAAPAGYPGAVYPFAESNFGFAEGKHLHISLVRDCTVR